MRNRGWLAVAFAAAVLVAVVPATTAGAHDRDPEEGGPPRVTASWAGRAGDLVSQSNVAGEWNQADGRADATFDVDVFVGGTPRLTLINLTTSDPYCIWNTDLRNWGIGVTRRGSTRLLNVGDTVAIDLRLTGRNRALTLHVQEPHPPSGLQVCASPNVATIELTIGGTVHTVTVTS